MAVYNVELRRSNGSNYEDKIYLKTSVGLVEGLLDEDDKIRASLLPSFVFGGMRFVSVWDVGGAGSSGLAALHTNLVVPFVTANGGTPRGCYIIFTKDITIEISEGYELYAGDGSSAPLIYPATHDAEKGDWLICISDDGLKWAVINNTYADATIFKKGVVKLAAEDDGVSGISTTVAMTPKATVAAINARAYSHPTYTAKEETFSDVETLSWLHVNSLGHVTSFAKRAIRVASESQTGVIQLASSSEAKAATEVTKAISPLRAKEMIDKFASIELVQSLPTDMSDHPAGKLILLQI